MPTDVADPMPRETALVALREPSAFYCMRMWARALQRACDVARRAGVPDDEVQRVCDEFEAAAEFTDRGSDWVVREVRRELYRLVSAGAAT